MRKNEPRAAKSKPKSLQSLEEDRAKEEYEFMLFLCYLRRSPKIVQQVFNPYVREMVYQFPPTSPIRDIVNKLRPNVKEKTKLDREHRLLFDNFSSLINLKELVVKMITMRTEIFPQRSRGFMDMAPDSYQSSPKVNLIRPKYSLTQKIAKEEGQTDIGLRAQSCNDNSSMLYAEPRFIEKLNELVHFRNNKKLKGSILLLEHNGSSIIGGRTYAVLRNNSVSIWEMSSHIFPFPFAQDINDKENGKSSDSEDSDNPKHSLKSVLIESPTFCLQNTFTAHRDKVTCASLSSDEFYLITGSIDRKVRLWCLRLKILIAEYSCHSKVVWDVHFNPSGYYFLSGSADGLMVLWSTEYENPTRIFMHGSDVYKVSFAKHPNYAISAGEDGRVKIWHLIEAQIKYCLEFDNPVINFSVGHSGIYLVVMQVDGRVTIYNMLEGVVAASFYFYSKHMKQKDEAKTVIYEVCFSEDERELACITNQHILLYSMQILESQRKVNVFDKTAGSPSNSSKAIPKEVLMVPSNLRLNFCGFRDYGLLVVGACFR